MGWEDIVKEENDGSQYDDDLSRLLLEHAKLLYDSSQKIEEISTLAKAHGDDRLIEMLTEYADVSIASREFMIKIIRFTVDRSKHT